MTRHSCKSDTLSVRAYNVILGCLILYGFIANAIIVAVSGDFFFEMNPIVFIVGYLVAGIIGVIMAVSSENVVLSFIGYNLVVLPIGALLSISLQDYSRAEILSAIVVTGAVVAVMLLLAIAHPGFFAGMGRTLFFSLLIGIISELIAIMLGYGGNLFNRLFVVIFSLYLGYDWYKAQSYPKTLDNAVDSALDIYLDIINLFIRILEIMGKKND